MHAYKLVHNKINPNKIMTNKEIVESNDVNLVLIDFEGVSCEGNYIDE